MPSWARLRKAIANAVPVLCYHNLGGNGVSRDDFEAQMQWLDNNGYKTLTSSELKAVLEGRKLDCPSVVITFDDAYRDLLTYAKDVLERHKFRALVFVINNRIRPESRIGEQGEINSDNAHRGYFQMGDTSPWLSTVELKTLHDSGIFEIGSHSYTHAMEPSGRIVEGEPPRHWAYEAWRDKESD